MYVEFRDFKTKYSIKSADIESVPRQKDFVWINEITYNVENVCWEFFEKTNYVYVYLKPTVL